MHKDAAMFKKGASDVHKDGDMLVMLILQCKKKVLKMFIKMLQCSKKVQKMFTRMVRMLVRLTFVMLEMLCNDQKIMKVSKVTFRKFRKML